MLSSRRAIATALGAVAAALATAAPAAADVATLREATATNAAGIQATVDAFRADLGDPNNGNTVGTQPAGRRQVTWDGADNDSAPSRLPADFFNAVAPRGIILGAGDPRITFQQSADAANATATPEEFGHINATYPTAFAPFSAPRLFSSLTANAYIVEFFVPGALTRAQTSGFGAVFTDVDVAGSTKLEFFDRFGTELLERNLLATPGDGSLSFLGVKFTGADVARVRITSGAAPLGPNDVTQGGASDIVVADDFIYGEPGAQPVPAVSFSSTEFGGAEGGAATVSVTRSGDPQATVKAGVSLSDGTATAGSDYEPTGGTVTFAPGETQKSITVPLATDDAQEAAETVSLTLDPATSNGMVAPTIGPNSTATLSIADVPPGDGPPPAVPPDTKAPLIEVAADGRQRLRGKRPPIALRAFCDEPCSVVAGGVVKIRGGAKPAKGGVGALEIADVQAGLPPFAFETVVLKLSARTAKLARAALRNGGRATAKLSIGATDSAGNRAETTARVRFY